ncbi:MAG: CocE/NonD family hydrolase [Candidatus Aminicenantes bacterium]|nr:MAG: CocE/NonD family hydrolase [Candidatus Aminicenantes bacterium]
MVSRNNLKKIIFTALILPLMAFYLHSGFNLTELQKAEEKKAKALPASLAGFSDEGIFHIYQNEDPLVEIQFKWEKGGKFSNTAVVTISGQSATYTTAIETDKQGIWTKIIQESALGTMEFVRKGSTVTRTFREKTVTIEIKDGAVLFDNFSPVLVSQTIRTYDLDKGGKQTLPIFILPGAMEECSLEFKEEEERSIAGKDIKFKKFIIGLPGVDITLWVDKDAKLYLADIPAQSAAYVREGYEILLQKAVTDPLLSKPEYEITVETNVGIPMRDGIKLATDIYRPKAEGKFPVILTRTPYKKEMAELQAKYYTRRGYVFAVQDCRGRFSSPGIWEPFVDEPKDGHDAIEWLADQPWSTGKVGMIGGSYVGWVQWWAARERPPHLVTIIPNVAPPDPFYNIPYEYGVFFIWGGIWWADVLEQEATADISGVAMSRISEKKYGKLLTSLPVIELDKKILGRENPYWRKWIDHPTNDDYWERANFLEYLRKVRIPVFHQSGWFDGDGIGSKLNYAKMKSHGHPYQKLTLGPWGHTDRAARSIGDLDFGPQAIIDLPRDYLRWFDYWLKGIDNGITKEPLVSIFAMGSNKWLHDDVYPLSYTEFQKWYLQSNGKANTSKGDGLLTPIKPPKDSPPDEYVYDPGDPTPSPDFYEETEEEEKKVKSVEEKRKEAEAHHEKITQSRSDILTYQTKPFEKPLTFAGPISAVLYASTSAKDTDWFMRLVWITKEGKTYRLAEGKIRARFHKSMKKPKFLKPGKIYKYTLDLWQTGITIPAGDSLRVEVASASFPLFSRNLNTGGHNEKETQYVKAEQMIYHSKKYPSHVLLPVIPDEKIK